MKIKGILTLRNVAKYRSFQIVSDWEDEIVAVKKIQLIKICRYTDFFIRNLNKFKLVYIYKLIEGLRSVRYYYLYYNMTIKKTFQISGFKNVIPIIIDFWLKEDDLGSFYFNHSNCKLMLITNKEVFDFLNSNNCPIPIEYFPLCLPTKYVDEEKLSAKKDIDILFAGRRDPVFWEYVLKYTNNRNDVEYVYMEIENDITTYYSSKFGKLNVDYNSRENYLNLLSRAKFTFYTTPGMDNSKEGANGYNQVTPRFLELISSGCIVLGRYPNNTEVDYFRLKDISPQISCYEDFCKSILFFQDPINRKNHINNYYNYLINHSMRTRIDLLNEILIKHKIKFIN